MNVCHPIPADGRLTLTDVMTPAMVVAGTSTLVGRSMMDGLTYVALRDTEENGGCWTWGHDTDFYVEALGCTIVFMGGEG